MGERFGLGPVFAYEWLTASRRWQMYAGRSAFVALILAALCVVWKVYYVRPDSSPQQAAAEFGEAVYYTLIGTELTLVLLVAPAATAGAICLDKARGTLLHVLVTDLSDTEIVLGKLAARLVPVLGLLLCSVPVMFLCTLLGGINPEALFGAMLVMLGIAVLGCTLALTLSVWGQKTHEVLLATYLAWILVLLAYPVWSAANTLTGVVPAAPFWLLEANPYRLAFAPYSQPASVTADDYLVYVVACLALSVALAFVALARIRPTVIRHASRAARASEKKPRFLARHRWRWRLSPTLNRSPLLWREWHCRRPSRWSRWIWGIYFLLALAFSAFAVAETWTIAGASPVIEVIGPQVVAGLLLVSAGSASPLADERAQGTLDILLATPVPTDSILCAKWWGTFRAVPRLTILPCLTLLMICLKRNLDRLDAVLVLFGLILAYGAGFTSLGLAAATWTTRGRRAIGGTIACYAFMVVGWVFLALFIFGNSMNNNGYIMGSPLYGPVLVSVATQVNIGNKPGEELYDYVMRGAYWWIAIYLAAALVLYLATWATFDRCLGRMTNRQSPRPPRPGKPAATALPIS